MQKQEDNLACGRPVRSNCDEGAVLDIETGVSRGPARGYGLCKVFSNEQHEMSHRVRVK